MTTSAAGATPAVKGFASPEEALLELEDACRNQDIEAAVLAKDFVTEAKLMMEETLGDDEEIIQSVAETLELSFRLQIKENGIPDFMGAKCRVVRTEVRSPTITALVEECQFPNGEVSHQVLIASFGTVGW